MNKLFYATLFFAPILMTTAISTYAAPVNETAEDAHLLGQLIALRDEMIPLQKKVEDGTATPEEAARLYRLNDEFLPLVKQYRDDAYQNWRDEGMLTSDEARQAMQEACDEGLPTCNQDLIDAIDAQKDQPLRTEEEQALFEIKARANETEQLDRIMPQYAGKGRRADDCDSFGRLDDVDDWTHQAKEKSQITAQQSTAIRALACSEYEKYRKEGKSRRESAELAKAAAQKKLDQLIKDNEERLKREAATRRAEAQKRAQERREQVQQDLASARQAISGQLGSFKKGDYKVYDFVNGAEKETVVTDTLENAWDKDVPKMEGDGSNSTTTTTTDSGTDDSSSGTDSTPSLTPTSPLFILR